MRSSPRFRRFAFSYGSAFAILYVIALKFDLALFTVYPTIGVVLLGTHHSESDPLADIEFGSRSTRARTGLGEVTGCPTHQVKFG
jgi:hypothetical protein